MVKDSSFQLPLSYLPPSKKHQVDSTFLQDIEWQQTKGETYPSVLETLYPSKEMFRMASSRFKQDQFTSDTDFLANTQTLLSSIPSNPSCRAKEWQHVDTIYKDLDDLHFLDTYSYISWKDFLFLNESVSTLHSLAMIQICSPLTSLFMPFVIFLMPLIILKCKNQSCDFNNYMTTFQEVSKSHFLGKIVINASFSMQSLCYSFTLLAIYIMQMIHNFNACYNMYRNISNINKELIFLHSFLQTRVEAIKEMHLCMIPLPTYQPFCHTLNLHLEHMTHYLDFLGPPDAFSFSWNKFSQIGKLLHRYYDLQSNPAFRESLNYLRNCDLYYSHLQHTAKLLQRKSISKTAFAETETYFEKQQFYLHAIQPKKKSCKNNCSLKQSMVITGVNASGKTTFLKTLAINVFLSQQLGCGFYSEGSVLFPFTHLYCYLNIPDTNGRDSLFQAEARRCKEIIDSVKVKGRHLCFIDELFSGTNPIEAVQAAEGLLTFFAESNSEMRFVLTTHFTALCKKLSRHPAICNYQMLVLRDKESAKLQYTYRLKKGVSKIQGAIDILKELDYPQAILDAMQKCSKAVAQPL